MRLNSTGLRSHLAAALASGIIAVGLLAPAAHAQLGLPSDIIAATGELAPDQRERLRRYIDDNDDGLTAGQREQIERSRRALLNPLRERNVGSGFRVAYSDLLMPVVTPLASSEQEAVAINAAVIMGEIATGRSLSTLSGMLKDKRPAVRLAAAMGFERTLATARAGSPPPAFSVREATNALDQLRAAFEAEADPIVADGMVMGLAAGVRTDPGLLQGVRADAVRKLSQSISAKARQPESLAFALAFARAIEAMADVVRDPQSGIDAPTAIEAGAVAGDVIALALRSAESICATMRGSAEGQPAPEVVAHARTLLVQSENLYFLLQRRVNGPALRPGLADSICADNGKFARDALQMLTALESAPYNLKNRFPRK